MLDAEREFYERRNANPLRGLYELGVEATEQYEHARERVARFVHAKSEREIIFTRNTTEGINLVAYSYALPRLKPGDEILVTIMEHHSNLLPWQMAARRTGATLKYLECEPDGSFTEEKICDAVTPHNKACRADTCLECAWTGDPGRKTDRDGTRKRRCGTGGCGTGSAAYADRCHGT